VEKAVYHGLGGERAGEYMNADYETAAPETQIERIEEIIIGKNQRLVPVVRGKELLGVITGRGSCAPLRHAGRGASGAREDVDAEGRWRPQERGEPDAGSAPGARPVPAAGGGECANGWR